MADSDTSSSEKSQDDGTLQQLLLHDGNSFQFEFQRNKDNKTNGVEENTSEERDKVHQMLVQQRSLDESNLMSDKISQSLQKERQILQAKMYTSWLNYRLEQIPDAPQITDLFEDLRDGKLLLSLLSLLTERTLKPVKGNMRVHHLNNLTKVFEVLEEQNIKLVGIHNESICDGHAMYTLGLCWRIIYHFQVVQGMGDEVDGGGVGSVETALLQWCSDIAKEYPSATVESFQPGSWKNGFLLNALVHSFDTKLFDYNTTVNTLDDGGRLQHALDIGYNNYAVPKLFTVEDIENDLIDNKTLTVYVSMIREKFNSLEEDKRLEAIEVLKRLKSQIEELKKLTDEKGSSKLVNLPLFLSFEESKELSGGYKSFQKELLSSLSTLQNVEESIGSLTDRLSFEDIADMRSDCQDLSQRIKILQDNGSVSQERVKQTRVDFVKEKLKNRSEELMLLRKEVDEELPKDIIAMDTSKETLKSCERLTKEFLGRMSQMQLEVKSTCSLVDEAYKDKSLKKEARKELKTEAMGVLEEYAKLMTALEDQQSTAKTLLREHLKGVEGKFAEWKDQVKDLEAWLDEKVEVYEKLELKNQNVDELEDIASEVKELLSRMRGETWKAFETIALNWNGELCDEVNDDKYADVLSDIQTKFNKLHQVATGTLTRTNSMIKQKEAEDQVLTDLEQYNRFVDQQLQQVNDETLSDIYNLEALVQVIDSKDGEVNSFLDNARLVLQGNKFDDERMEELQAGLQQLSDRWEVLKDTCTGKHIRATHSDQLVKVQIETARNLVESLEEWKKRLREYTQRLHTITLKEYSTIEEVNEAVEELELLHSGIGINDEALAEYDRDTNILLDNLDEEKATELSANHFQVFFKAWDDIKADIENELTTLKENTLAQFANEENLIKEWEDKSLLIDKLMKVVAEVSAFSNDSATVENYEDYLAKFDHLEARVMDNMDMVDKILAEFKDLRENQLQTKMNREKVENSEESFMEKKNDLLELLIEAKKTVISVVQRMKLQDQYEEDVRNDLERWQKILDDNNDTLNRCDINRLSNLNETIKAIDILEALLMQIGTYEVSLSNFEKSSTEIVETLPTTSSAELTPSLRSIIKNWDLCQSKAEERLNGLRMQLVQLEKNESSVITEWKEKKSRTTAWLDEAIAETHTYCALPQQPFDLPKYLLQFQDAMSRITARLEFVKDQKDHGRHLVNDDMVQKQTNKELVLADVDELSHKEDLLQANLKTSNTMNDILRDRLEVRNETARNIDESVAEWQTLLDQYTDRLKSIDQSYEKGVNDLNETIDLLTTLFSDVKTHQDKLDAFKDNTALLVENLSLEQAGKANAACQLLYKNWNFNWDNTREKLNVMETKVRDDVEASEKMSEEWKASSDFINGWLTSAENDIDAYVKSGEEVLQATKEVADRYHARADDLHISEAIPREMVVRLQAEGKEVNEKVDHYLRLAVEGSHKGMDDVRDYQERKSALDNKLVNAAALLNDIDADSEEVEAVRTTLKSFWEELQSKTDAFSEIDFEANKKEGLRQLTELIAEAEMKSLEVETFFTDSLETCEGSPFSKESKNTLADDVDHFHEEWRKTIGNFLDAKTALEKRLEEEQALMAEWQNKTMVTEELITMSEEISVHAENIGDLDDYEEYLSKLESKVLNDSSAVDESIDKGSEIYDTVSEDNKAKIKHVVDAFTLKKTKMQENLITARKAVAKAMEKKKQQKENEEEFNLSFTEWQRILDEWALTLNDCNIEKTSSVVETKMVISTLENLNDDINSHDSKLEEFQQRAEELLAALETEKSLTWKMELKLFLSRYQHFKEKVWDRLTVFQNSLKMQLSRYQGNEAAIMEEWTPSVIRILDWLKDTEKECSTYGVLPEDHIDIHKFLADFEGLVGKINAKMEYIKEQKDHGRELVFKLKEKANQDKLSNDIVKIEEGEEKLLRTLSTTKNVVEEEIRAIVLKRVGAFWEWLPTVQKRSEERNAIGPDFNAVSKQIQEMKVIQAQTIQMSFSGLLDPYKSNTILTFLSEEERTNLRSANEEWIKIKSWVDKRHDMLSSVEESWNDFKARKLDLVEYLRDTDLELKAVIGIDLNDTEAVERRSSGCLNVMGGMEARKDHVALLTDTADRLINLLISVDQKSDGENTLPNSVRTQVADILDSWNILVKKSIEFKTKLHKCVTKFESCCTLYQEVRDWVNNCVQLLNRFTVDTSGEHIDTLRARFEAKESEEDAIREKLNDVALLDEDLSREGELCPTYELPGKVKDLSRDFNEIVEQLNELKTFPGRVKMLSRRVRGGTTRVARSLTSRWEGSSTSETGSKVLGI